MFAAGPLAVVGATNDEATAPVARPGGERSILVLERELCDRGDVRAVGHDGRAVRRQVASRDVVTDHDQDAPLQAFSHRSMFGRWLDVRASDDGDPPCLVRRGRGQDLPVVDGRVVWCPAERGRPAERPRIGEDTVEGSRRRGRRRHQVDVVVFGSATPREVAVEGADRVGPARRRLTHTDTGSAGGLEHAGAGIEQLVIDA